MEEHNESIFSVEKIGPVFRHPLIIICSFLIIFNAVQAVVSVMPKKYLIYFDLSFETPPGAVARNFATERKTAIEKIASGESLRKAIDAAVEGLGEKERGAWRDQLAEALPDKTRGLRIEWTESSDRVKLSFGVQLTDPKVAFRLIKSLMEKIMAESAESVGKKTEEEMNLLGKQLALYKEKRDALSVEIAGIRNDLMKRFPDLTEEERAQVRKMIEDKAAGASAIEKFSTNEEMLSNLSAELADLAAKKTDLVQAIETGTYSTPLTTEQLYKEDPYLVEYAKSIAAKELEIAALGVRGYKEEHPTVKMLEAEVAKLKAAKKDRMEALNRSVLGAVEDERAKEKAKAEIEEIDFKMDLIRRKISQLEKARAIVSGKLEAGDTIASELRAKIDKGFELKRELALIDAYYQDSRKKLEDATVRYNMIKAGGGMKIIVLKKPSIPPTPSSSREAINMMLGGFVMAAAAGLGVAFLIDKINEPIRSGKELIERYALPVIGTIDRIVIREEAKAANVRRNAVIAGTIVIMIITRVLVKALAPLIFNTYV